mgnify:CR=1 FL=1
MSNRLLIRVRWTSPARPRRSHGDCWTPRAARPGAPWRRGALLRCRSSRDGEEEEGDLPDADKKAVGHRVRGKTGTEEEEGDLPTGRKRRAIEATVGGIVGLGTRLSAARHVRARASRGRLTPCSLAQREGPQRQRPQPLSVQPLSVQPLSVKLLRTRPRYASSYCTSGSAPGVAPASSAAESSLACAMHVSTG